MGDIFPGQVVARYVASPPTLSDGMATPLITDSTGNLKVNIGASGVTVSGDVTVVGKAASGATKAGNPVLTAAVFNTTPPTVTNGQVVDNQATARGFQKVQVTNASDALMGDATTPWVVQGNAASGATKAGFPVLTGAVFNTVKPTVTNGQAVDLQASARGIQLISLFDNQFGTDAIAYIGTGGNDGAAFDAVPLLGTFATPYQRNNAGTWDMIRHSFIQTVTGITGTGAGTALDISTTPCSSHTLVAIRTAGATDVVVINFEGSLDNTNWFSMGTGITSVAGGNGVAFFSGKAARYVRYNVTTVGVGNTFTIEILSTRG